MGRNFDPTPHLLKVSDAIVPGVPMTMACWFRMDVTNLDSMIVVIAQDGVDALQSHRMFYLEAGTRLFLQARDDTTAGNVIFVWSSDTEWHHLCGVLTNNSSRALYLDGKLVASNTTTIDTLTGQDYVGLGSQTGGAATPLDGTLAEVALWNVPLGPSDIADLGIRRYAPSLVRINSLRWYRSLRFPDYNIGTFGQQHRFANTGTTFRTGPPGIVYPRERMIFPTEQVAAGGLSIPVAYHHYQRNTG